MLAVPAHRIPVVASLILKAFIGESAAAVGGSAAELALKRLSDSRERREAEQCAKKVAEAVIESLQPILAAPEAGRADVPAVIAELEAALSACVNADLVVSAGLNPQDLYERIAAGHPIEGLAMGAENEGLYRLALRSLANSLVEAAAGLPGFPVAFAREDLRQGRETAEAVGRIEAVLQATQHAVTALSAPAIDTAVIIDAFEAASSELLHWRRSLPGGESFVRPELEELKQRIEADDPRITMLLGPPGSGKSALMRELAEALRASGTPFLAIKTDSMPADTETPAALQEWLGLPRPVDECLRAVASGRSCVLILDQLDALCQIVDVKTKRLGLLTRLARQVGANPNVRVVLSCREFESRHDARFERLEAESLHLNLPPWEAVEKLLTQRGMSAVAWPREFQDILRTPQHLDVFLRLVNSGQREVFTTYQQMLERLWDLSVAGSDGQRERITLANELALRMAEREELWTPKVSWEENFAAALNQLVAAGLLKFSNDGRRVAFAHQTIFDFVRARAFVAREHSLSDYALLRLDGLFVRPVLWSALNYLRDTDPVRYRDELRTLWQTPNLRSHLKLLLVEFVGSQVAPTPDEAALLLPLLCEPALRRHAAFAVRESPGWFVRIMDGVLPKLMKGDEEEADVARVILEAAAAFSHRKVVGLMVACWLPDESRDRQLLSVLLNLKSWDGSAVDVAEQTVSRAPASEWAAMSIVQAISASAPDEAPRVVRAAFDRTLREARAKASVDAPEAPSTDDAELSLAARMDYNRRRFGPVEKLIDGSTEWYELPAIAEAAPFVFLEILMPWLLEVLGYLVLERWSIVNQYLEDRSSGFGARPPRKNAARDYPTVAAFMEAAIGAAKQDSDRFLAFCETHKRSDLLSVHRLLARGLLELAGTHSRAVVDYLLDNPRRLWIGDDENYHRLSQDLIKAVVPNLETEAILRLEQAIKVWSPYHSFPIDDDRKTKRDRRTWTRHHRLRLLRVLPQNRLSAETRRHIAEEERAFPDLRDWDSRITVGCVGSTVSSEQMRKAKDDDILNLFEELPDRAGSTGLKTERLADNVQASLALAELAKTDADRLIRIVERMKPGTQERPIADAIRALAEAGTVDDSTILALLARFETAGLRSETFRQNAAWAAETIARRSKGLHDADCDRLAAWLQDAATRESDDNSGPDRDQNLDKQKIQSILFGYGGGGILPDGNYPILRALHFGYLFRESPAVDQYLDLLERHAERTEHPGVWEALLPDLTWVVRRTGARGRSLIVRLFSEHDELARSTSAVQLIASIQWEASESEFFELFGYFERSGWALADQAAGELLMLRHLHHAHESRVAEAVSRIFAKELDSPSENSRLRGCCYAAAHVWHAPECRALATPYLSRAFELGGDAAAAAMALLRHDKALLADRDTEVVLRSMADNSEVLRQEQHLGELTDALVALTADLPAVVAHLATNMLDVVAAGRQFSVSTSDLVEIALTLQRMEGFRSQGLDLFERLLELGVHEAAQALSEVDRRPLQSGSGPAPRRRRRRPSRPEGQ